MVGTKPRVLRSRVAPRHTLFISAMVSSFRNFCSRNYIFGGLDGLGAADFAGAAGPDLAFAPPSSVAPGGGTASGSFQLSTMRWNSGSMVVSVAGAIFQASEYICEMAPSIDN